MSVCFLQEDEEAKEDEDHESEAEEETEDGEHDKAVSSSGEQKYSVVIAM